MLPWWWRLLTTLSPRYVPYAMSALTACASALTCCAASVGGSSLDDGGTRALQDSPDVSIPPHDPGAGAFEGRSLGELAVTPMPGTRRPPGFTSYATYGTASSRAYGLMSTELVYVHEGTAARRIIAARTGNSAVLLPGPEIAANGEGIESGTATVSPNGFDFTATVIVPGAGIDPTETMTLTYHANARTP